MMTSRRSFFQILSAALAVTPALPAVAVTRAIAPAASPPAREIKGMVAMARECTPLVSMSVSELVHSSMRMLGVLASGETLCGNDMKACLVVLRMLRPGLDPFPSDLLWMTSDQMLWLRFDLAAEMSPEFGVVGFRERYGWSYGHSHEMPIGALRHEGCEREDRSTAA